MAQRYNDSQFRRQVDKAMATVSRVLANTRKPELPSEISHEYDDKFALAEHLTNTTLASLTDTLEAIGITPEKLLTMRQWASDGHEVTLRFSAKDKLEFDREAKRKIESPTVTITTSKESSGMFSSSSTKSKSTTVTTTISEYFWRYTVQYSLVAFKGASADGDDTSIIASDKTGTFEIMTKVNVAPQTSSSAGGENALLDRFTPLQVQQVSLTWLLKLFSPELEFSFKIDRKNEVCRTPRRNPEIDCLFNSVVLIQQWAKNVQVQIRVWQQCGGKAALVENASSDEIFIPTIPLFEKNESEPPAYSKPENPSKMAVKISSLHSGPSSVLLQLGDVNAFLAEHRRSISALKDKYAAKYSGKSLGLHSSAEAFLSSMLNHVQRIVEQFLNAVGYIEYMLEQQLYSAIGRDINPQSFYQFMKHHQSRLFNNSHQPQQFCYAVRRPNCFPEGTVSIEALAMGETPAEPVTTIVRKLNTSTPMDIKLNAQCTIQLKGDKYLHAYLAQSFAGADARNFSLVARARQFSSFILMVGKIDSATSFQPQHAIIIKDKDDLKIPLVLETLPSAKEFKDAIESLSPEQQRFAKAYRGMQLEGTVFAVAFIQLKPQLERLLNLPAGSLVKEIQLSQDLQTLFIDHQIPSDLLTYDGSDTESKTSKLETVKAHVKAIMDMIKEAKAAEIEEAKKEHMYLHPESYGAPATLNAMYNDDDEGNDLSSMMRGGSMNKSKKMAKGGGGEASMRMMSRSMPRSMSRSTAAPAMAMAMMDAPPVAMAMSMAPPPPPPAMMGGGLPPPIQVPGVAAAAAESASVSVGGKKTTNDKTNTDTNDIVSPLSAEQENDRVDFTQFPALLDRQFLEFDVDSALRPTKIIVQDAWIRQTRAGLLAKPTTEHMSEANRRSQKDKAFDLLDAISRSGTLPIEDCASLHVVVAVTHQFDKSVVNTVVQGNTNPIEKVERSALIIASAVHDRPVEQLVRENQLDRIANHCGTLMTLGDRDGAAASFV